MWFAKFFAKLRQAPEIQQADQGQADIADCLAEQARQLAFKKLLHHQRFVELDGLNEYDEDYRHFLPRGDLLTEEMRKATVRLQAMQEQHQGPRPDDNQAPVSVVDASEGDDRPV